MTAIDYWSGYASMKRSHAVAVAEEKPRTIMQLALRHGSYVLVSRKKKGAGKGYKENYQWRWNDRRAYMNELRELFPREYGLALCREEHEELVTEDWWDTPDYRAAHLKEYRSRITEIRKEYGLGSSDVAEFMRV